MQILFPEQVQTHIEELANVQFETPEKLRNWWDKQIDLLLDEFNKTPNVKYDDWTTYLNDFYLATKATISESYKGQIKKLFDLTRNQLGGMELARAVTDFKENFNILNTNELLKEIRERLNRIERLGDKALQYIKAKWRFDSNLTVQENILHYATQYELFPSFQFDDVAFLTRALDMADCFLGSVDELFRLFPLTEEDYAELAECDATLPHLYNKLKVQVQTAESEPDEKQLQANITFHIQQTDVRELDVENKYFEWWHKNLKKIELTFRSFSLLTLAKLFHGKLSDQDLIRHEASLRTTFYSLMPKLEVFSEQEMMQNLNLSFADVPGIVYYKQSITRKLRDSENPFELSRVKESFISSVKNYQLKDEEIEPSMLASTFMAALKGIIETLCENFDIIDNPYFFKQVIKEVEGSSLPAEDKLNFLDFLVRTREGLLLNAAPLKEKAKEFREKNVEKMHDELPVELQKELDKLLLLDEQPQKFKSEFFLQRPAILKKIINAFKAELEMFLLSLWEIPTSKERTALIIHFLQESASPVTIKNKILNAVLAYDIHGIYFDREMLFAYQKNDLNSESNQAREIFSFVEQNHQAIPAAQFGIGLIEAFAAWQIAPLDNSLFQKVLSHPHMKINEDLKNKLNDFVMGNFPPKIFSLILPRSESAPASFTEIAEKPALQTRRFSVGIGLFRRSPSKEMTETPKRSVSGDAREEHAESSTPRTSGGTRMRRLKEISNQFKKDKQKAAHSADSIAPSPEETIDLASLKPLERLLAVYAECLETKAHVAQWVTPFISVLIKAYEQERIEAVDPVVWLLAEQMENIIKIEGSALDGQNPIFEYIDSLKISLHNLGFSPELNSRPNSPQLVIN